MAVMDVEMFDRVCRSLTNVTPDNEQLNRTLEVREAGKTLAYALAANCKNSRERSLAITHLEETVMWAVKSIVLEE